MRLVAYSWLVTYSIIIRMKTTVGTTYKNTRGFTLIELLVVIAIITVLASLILAAMQQAQKGARDTRRQSDLSQYKTALAQYAGKNNGTYPVSALVSISSSSEPYSSLSGEYLPNYVDDPRTGQHYRYISTADDFGMCADLERSTETYVVGPTFSGKGSAHTSGSGPISPGTCGLAS